jgi:hypothetical protein
MPCGNSNVKPSIKMPFPRKTSMSDKSEVNRFIGSNESVKSVVDACKLNPGLAGQRFKTMFGSPQDGKDRSSKTQNNEGVESNNQSASVAPQSFADLCSNTNINNQLASMLNSRKMTHLMPPLDFSLHHPAFRGSPDQMHHMHSYYNPMFGHQNPYHPHHPYMGHPHPHFHCCSFQHMPCCQHECQMVMGCCG